MRFGARRARSLRPLVRRVALRAPFRGFFLRKKRSGGRLDAIPKSSNPDLQRARVIALDPCRTAVKLSPMSDRTRQASARNAGSDPATTFARSGTSWSEVSDLDDDTFRIRLGGLLRSNWMVGVCNGLAREQLSIQRSHARRLTHDGSWIAELHVVALAGAQNPLQIPYIEFAEEDDIPASGALQLDNYQLLESPDHGGTLRLTFSAKDAVGLLGALLQAFASLSLLPVEMHIETHDQEAHDCLWLAASGPSKPSQADRDALDSLLRGAVRS
jgi:hypothetical protein